MDVKYGFSVTYAVCVLCPILNVAGRPSSRAHGLWGNLLGGSGGLPSVTLNINVLYLPEPTAKTVAGGLGRGERVMN
jgi:hypothetical protein